jgi:hypothetical protein
MGDWGGAQWLIAILMIIRSFMGAATASGAVTVRKQDSTLWSRYWSGRVSDVLLVLVLVWGGFF